jgi:hypothetical protein
MSLPPDFLIRLDSHRYQDLLSLVIDISLGQALPGELEARIKDLEQIAPLATALGGVLAKALNNTNEWLALTSEERAKSENLDRFLRNNDVLSRTQGALAVLLGVGELVVESTRSDQTSTPKRRKKMGDSRDKAKGKKSNEKSSSPKKTTTEPAAKPAETSKKKK